MVLVALVLRRGVGLFVLFALEMTGGFRGSDREVVSIQGLWARLVSVVVMVTVRNCGAAALVVLPLYFRLDWSFPSVYPSTPSQLYYRLAWV